MSKPRLLDLFCCQGGAAMGYSRAGFDVVGVDIVPQPRYPFAFVQMDALEALRVLLADGAIVDRGGRYWRMADFDAIHASPPCQGYSRLRHLPWLKDRVWPKLIDPCRELMQASGKPWAMENVADAPLDGVTLCGQMFDLPVYRHRLFESSAYIWQPEHAKHTVVIGSGRMVNDRRKGTLNASSASGAWGKQTIVTVAGGQFKKTDGERAMGIDWMSKAGLAQAIPPDYTEFIGRHLLQALPLFPAACPPPAQRDGKA